MFSAAVADHKARRAELTKVAGEAERESLQALDRALQAAAAKTNSGSSEAYRQQQEIGQRLKAVRRKATQLQGRTVRLAAAAERLEQAALTFGDLENYVQAVIQPELASVARALRRVQQQQQQAEVGEEQLQEVTGGG